MKHHTGAGHGHAVKLLLEAHVKSSDLVLDHLGDNHLFVASGAKIDLLLSISVPENHQIVIALPGHSCFLQGSTPITKMDEACNSGSDPAGSLHLFYNNRDVLNR